MRTMLGVVLGLAVVAGGAFAQDEKKKDEAKKDEVMPVLGLPARADYVAKCKFTEEQCVKVDKIYTDYKDKAAEAQKNVKEGADKKAAGKDLRTLRTEIVAKLKEICSSDEQKTSFDEITAPKKKQK
jgi:hypothetical protein